MAFSVSELASIANAALDFHYKGQPFAQSIQDKPLLSLLESNRKTFPGGKGDITIPVKGNYAFEAAAGALTGFTHNDAVDYGTMAGIERVAYPWREIHTGWTVTFTELKIDGISVTDTQDGSGTRKHSKRELTAITGIMQDKVETFSEVTEKALNTMFWGDGTADAKGFLGLRAFLTKTPTVGTTGGINRATSAWWQNRYKAIATASENIAEVIHTEMRQLRRYGGKPTRALCGSEFLDELVKELRSKGYYTDRGWSSSGAADIAIADVRYNNLIFQYDPTLDDASLASTCYLIDPRHLYVYAMEDEWGKDHTPARPHDIYALYKARTYTGQLVCRHLNCHGVLDLTGT